MSQSRHKPRKARPTGRTRTGAPTVSAALIVKDEAGCITRCLESVRPLVDEIVVYDTGSTDDTIALCRAAGARVIEGYWDDDFSRARNAALAECRGEWVLSIDADETAHGTRADLRSAWANAQDANAGLLLVTMSIVEADGHSTHDVPQRRLFRRRGATWTGRIHEQPQRAPEFHAAKLDRAVLTLTHHGYAGSQEHFAEKNERNLRLALAEVCERSTGEDAQALAQALFNLGRALLGLSRYADSFSAFADVRGLVEHGWLWEEATAHLARIAILTANYAAAIDLADELAKARPDLVGYAHYLAAEALLAAGQREAAQELMATVDEIVDPTGRRYDAERVRAYKIELGAIPA